MHWCAPAAPQASVASAPRLACGAHPWHGLLCALAPALLLLPRPAIGQKLPHSKRACTICRNGLRCAVTVRAICQRAWSWHCTHSQCACSMHCNACCQTKLCAYYDDSNAGVCDCLNQHMLVHASGLMAAACVNGTGTEKLIQGTILTSLRSLRLGSLSSALLCLSNTR